MEFYAYHGVFSEENKLGQMFVVDLVMEADLSEAAETDDVTKTVNYAEAYEATKEIVEERTYDLVETVTAKICEAVLDKFSIVKRVTVKVMKKNPPIPGHYDYVAIEMTRERA